MVEILDHYAEENYDGTYIKLDCIHPCVGADYSAAEQCTLLTEMPGLEEGEYYTLDSVKFYLMRVDSDNLLTGNLVVKIYDSDDCVANGGCPTGEALATSGTVDITTLSTSGHTLVEFTFTGDNRITLDGTDYAISIEVSESESGFDGEHYISVGADGSSPGHTYGSMCQYYGGTWQTDDTKDLIFYIYGAAPAGGGGLIGNSSAQLSVPDNLDVDTIASRIQTWLNNTLSIDTLVKVKINHLRGFYEVIANYNVSE